MIDLRGLGLTFAGSCERAPETPEERKAWSAPRATGWSFPLRDLVSPIPIRAQAHRGRFCDAGRPVLRRILPERDVFGVKGWPDAAIFPIGKMKLACGAPGCGATTWAQDILANRRRAP